MPSIGYAWAIFCLACGAWIGYVVQGRWSGVLIPVGLGALGIIAASAWLAGALISRRITAERGSSRGRSARVATDRLRDRVA